MEEERRKRDGGKEEKEGDGRGGVILRNWITDF